MAKADINLDINTRYNGDGIKKLNNAIRTSSGSINKVSGIVQNVTSSMTSLDGAAGKAAAGLGRLVGAATSMGVVGVVVAGVMAGVQKLGDMFAEAGRKADEMAKKTAEALKNKLENAIKSAENTYARLQKKFHENIDLGRNGRQMEDARTQGTIDRMEHQKQQALLGKSGVEAAKIELEWIKKIEAEKGKLSSKAISDAQKEVDAQNGVIKAIKQQIEEKKLALQTERQTNLAVAQGFMKSGNNSAYALDIMNRGSNRETVIEREIKELQKQLDKALDKQDEAKVNLEKVFQSGLTQESGKYNAILAGQQKIKDEEKKAKEKEIAERKKQMEDALKKRKEIIQQMQKEIGKIAGNLQKSLKKASEDVKKALQEKAAKDKDLLDLQKKQAEDAAALFDQRAQAAGADAGAGVVGANPVRFEDWKKNRDDAEKDKEKREKQQQKNVDRAIRERDHIGERLFDRNGRLKRGANAQDIKRYKELSEYINLNDPKKRKDMQDKAKQIEQKKIELAEKTKKKLDDIDKKLGNVGL